MYEVDAWLVCDKTFNLLILLHRIDFGLPIKSVVSTIYIIIIVQVYYIARFSHLCKVTI